MISEISTWFGNLTHTKSYTYLVQGARLSGLTPPTRRLALAVQWHPSAATQGLSLTVPIWRPTRRVSLAAAVTVTVPQPWDSQAWPGLELGPHEAARSTSNWVGQCTASLTLPNLNCVVPIIIISDCPPGCQSRCATDSGSSRCSHGQSSDRHSCRVRVKGASRSLETCYASRASSSSILALSVWISIRSPTSFPWGRRSLLSSWAPSSLARRYVIAKIDHSCHNVFVFYNDLQGIVFRCSIQFRKVGAGLISWSWFLNLKKPWRAWEYTPVAFCWSFALHRMLKNWSVIICLAVKIRIVCNLTASWEISFQFLQKLHQLCLHQL